jgi:type VI secretion system protein ImpC
MAKPRSLEFGGVNLSVGGEAAPPARPEPSMPFRILLLGHFSGRAADKASILAERRPLQVDRDNLEDVLGRYGVRAHIPIVGEDISIKELDDFHPERLFQQLKVFEALRGLRRRLSNPATFAAAAAEVRAWAPEKAAPSPVSQDAPAVPTDMTPADLLDQMLSGAAPSGGAATTSSGEPNWNALVAQIVQPYVLPRTDPRQPELVALVDEATGAYLRSILHHPDFQAIEAAWRAVYFLVRRLDTDSNLKVYLLDVSREELAADLAGAESQRPSALHKFLVEQTVHTPGGQPWAVVVGNYTFASTSEDVLLLLRLARIVRQAGTPFLAAAHPSIFGCASLAETPDSDNWQSPAATAGCEAWDTLRRLPEAAYLGLAVPRFLLRLPYGKSTGTAEQFAFEEFPGPAAHEHLLWGNPAFACALLLGQSFSQEGWDMKPGLVEEIDGLPAYSYREDGESLLKPCAEVILADRAIERIVDAGLIPLRSVKGSDVVRVPLLQALASSAAPLAGRWE